jgi:hypothetical protein
VLDADLVTRSGVTFGRLTVANDEELLLVRLELDEVSGLIHSRVRVVPGDGSEEALQEQSHRGVETFTHEVPVEWAAGVELEIEVTMTVPGLDGEPAITAVFPVQRCFSGTGDMGCEAAYWLDRRREWRRTGFAPGDRIEDVFARASVYSSVASESLEDALEFVGGDGIEGSAELLLRAGAASLLSAAHPRVSSPRTAEDVIAAVDEALASLDRDTIRELAEELAEENLLGCPLD